jgi:hypothetical protein
LHWGKTLLLGKPRPKSGFSIWFNIFYLLVSHVDQQFAHTPSIC